MTENIYTQLYTPLIQPQTNIQAAEKPPAQTLTIQGSCEFMSDAGTILPYEIHKNPRFQLFVSTIQAKENEAPLSMDVEQNAYFFLQNRNPSRLWFDYCDWFTEQNKKGRFLNETPDGRKANQTPIDATPPPSPHTASNKAEEQKQAINTAIGNAISALQEIAQILNTH